MTLELPETISRGQLKAAAIPPRFWTLTEDPFPTLPIAHVWWEQRAAMAQMGRGLIGGKPSLPALVAILKRLLRDPFRPRIMSGEDSPCLYVEAPDIYAGKTFEISELQRLVFEAPYLVLANVGQQFNGRAVSVMEYTLRRRFQNGTVSFVHLDPDNESTTAVQQLSSSIPMGMFLL